MNRPSFDFPREKDTEVTARLVTIAKSVNDGEVLEAMPIERLPRFNTRNTDSRYVRLDKRKRVDLALRDANVVRSLEKALDMIEIRLESGEIEVLRSGVRSD